MLFLNITKEKVKNMYSDYLVDIPESKGKITYITKGNARYVYYEYNRSYDPTKQYTTVKRVTIGKVSEDDETKMRPNENYSKYFSDAHQLKTNTTSMKMHGIEHMSTLLRCQIV